MIAASDPKEYVPYGRQQIKNHPGRVVMQTEQAPPVEGLVQKLSQVNIQDTSPDEFWLLRDCDRDDEKHAGRKEEELYVSGYTAIVSRGIAGKREPKEMSSDILVACYTMESPIKQALFCNFIHIESNETVKLPSLCLIDSTRITVYTDSGEDYIAPLQFQVATAWSTKFGLLLERVSLWPNSAESKSDTIQLFTPTTIFSLVHPLHEISPLLAVKQGGHLSYMTDPCLRIVYTCEEPSICVLVDLRSGLHSLWKLRQATSKEVQLMSSNDTTMNSMSMSNCSMSTLSPSFAQLSQGRPSLGKTVFFPCVTNMSSSLSSCTSFSGMPPGSPIFHSPAISRLSGFHSPRTSKSPLANTSSIDARLATSQVISSVAMPKPIVPEICLEYMWSDLPPSRMSTEHTVEVKKPEGRVFLTTDLLGQQFLCYPSYVKQDTLICARLTRTNNEVNPDYIVGSGNAISAKDAVPILSLKMMVVLETSGSIILYSGPVPIGKISLAGVTAELASSSYLKASAVSMNMLKHNHRRMSMLSSTVLMTGEGGFFEDRHQLLSPVVSTPDPVQFRKRLASSTPGPTPPASPHQPADHVLSLRDPVAYSFSVEFHNGSLFRISLPEISSSPLVGECIRVLKSILMKDDALHLLTKWYSVRNAPGTQDISPDLEWKQFISTLLELLGYELETLFLMQQYSTTDCDTPAKNTKKRRASDLGTLEDWEYVKNSNHDLPIGLAAVISLPDIKALKQCEPPSKVPTVNTSAPLYQYMYVVLFSFHLLYEELKLNTLMSECLPMLARLLHQLSYDLKLDQYVHHYWSDFPQYCPLKLSNMSQMNADTISLLAVPNYLTPKPPSVFNTVFSLVESSVNTPYPYITSVNNFTKNILQVIGIITKRDSSKVTVHVSAPGSRLELPFHDFRTDLSPEHRAVLLMNSLNMKKSEIEVLPCSVGLIFGDLLQSVCENPLPGWNPDIYELIGRLDMVPLHVDNVHPPAKKSKPVKKDLENPENPESTRNIHNILSLRFNKDQRVLEVIKLLESHEPVSVNITQRAEVTDHEFIEEQERHLYTLCNRTMALPVGRGMMELHTEEPMTNEPLAIPKICLHGRAPPCGTRVDLSHIEVVPNMTLWPMFHNGVAAGLRIPPNAKTVSSTWISFNKPKDPSSDFLPEHAGFLMALGLTGHLNRFNEYRLYEYLTKCHEMTSIGLLLGIAASKRGTMEVRFKKLFSVHIESLLPPTSIELDIFQNVQVAALVGIGLLYQGTGHRHIAEVLLSEIGRPPGPEMENSTDRECYSLAAGLGLGLVVLRKGANPSGLQDLSIADTLHHYMVGGPKRPLTGSQKEKYKSPSYQIREEDRVNNNVTAPGAILALGLMYFNTGNRAVASWLEAPQSEYMLGFVCPDLLLLRIIAHGLIMWDDVQPSLEWVESHVPDAIKPYCFTKPKPDTDDIDYETMNQAFVNLISGACFVLGLKFAGSANEQAFQTLHQVCNVLLSLAGKSIAELAGKSTIETCINVVLISLSMVMCGTGDLEVVRLCRYLRMRVSNSVVTYGSHLATHMALGLLFLGGGAYTLSTSPESIAALICAFFPRFPTHSNDNRYHLQALRHLYVLAAEPRLILPKDIETGELCYANLTAVFLDTPHYTNQSCKLFAPCLLPELRFLKEVRINDDRYWPVIFQRDKNWNQLEDMMRLQKCVGVKLRAGCLPHKDDPHGYRTLLAQSLSTDLASAWAKEIDSILAFTSDQVTSNLIKNLVELSPGTVVNTRHLQFLSRLAYECVTRDKLSLLKTWIHIVETIGKLERAPDNNLMWQLKIILAYGCDSSLFKMHHIPPDLYLFIKHSMMDLTSKWEKELGDKIINYMAIKPVSASDNDSMKLAAYLTYFGIPSSSIVKEINSSQSNPLQNQMNLKEFNVSWKTFNKIIQFKS